MEKTGKFKYKKEVERKFFEEIYTEKNREKKIEDSEKWGVDDKFELDIDDSFINLNF